MKFDKNTLNNYLHKGVGDVSDFEKWLLENEDNPEVDSMLMEAWGSYGITDNSQASGAFRYFKSRVKQREKLDRRGKEPLQANTGRGKAMLWIYRAAAIFMVPFIALALHLYSIGRQETEWLEAMTGTEETRSIVLPDNSIIKLYSNSSLIYPSRFDKNSRHVFLQGEGYANITKNQEVPFLITAGEIEVKVYGTQFNIRSFAADSESEVTLVEGSVAVTSTKSPLVTAMLNPGEVARYDKLSGTITRYNFNPNYYRPLVDDGGFTFINARLSDITAAIGRHFGKQIIVLDKKLGEERYYANYVNHESLEQILASLNSNGQMRIRHLDDAIIIDAVK